MKECRPLSFLPLKTTTFSIKDSVKTLSSVCSAGHPASTKLENFLTLWTALEEYWMLNFVFNFQPYNDLLLNLAGNPNQKGFFDNQSAQSKVFHAALTAQNISSSLCDSIYSTFRTHNQICCHYIVKRNRILCCFFPIFALLWKTILENGWWISQSISWPQSYWHPFSGSSPKNG